jgi:hypothetical protein
MENVIRYMNKRIAELLAPLRVGYGEPVDYKGLEAYAVVRWPRYTKDSGVRSRKEELRGQIEIYSRETNLYALSDRVVSFIKGLRHKFALDNGQIVEVVGEPEANLLELEGWNKAHIVFQLRTLNKEE